MFKVAKLHRFNMQIYKGGIHFKAIWAKIFLLVLINFIQVSYVRNPILDLDANSIYFTFYVIVVGMLMSNIFHSTHTIYEDDSKDVKREINSYLALYNILPVGRRGFFLGRLKYSFDVYMGVWLSSFSIVAIYHLANYTFYEVPFDLVFLVEFLKLYIFFNLMLLLGTVGITAIYFKTKIQLALTVLICVATYLAVEWGMVSPHNFTWWIYPMLNALIVAGIIVWRCYKINDSDIIEGKGNSYKSILSFNIFNKISLPSLLFIDKEFILVIPILTLVFILIMNTGLLFALIVPYLIVLTLMAFKSSVTIVNTHLSLMKSLPTDKRKVVKGIMISITTSEVVLILILLLIRLLNIRIGNDVNLGILTIILFGIKLPVATSAMILLLPKTILGIYANKQPWENVLGICYLLVLTGGVIAAFGYLFNFHGGPWAAISVSLYALAIYAIKTTYDYMVSRLEGPLNIQDL